MQIGIDSFAAAYDDTSLAVNASERLRNLVEQIEHADKVGLDVFGIGEHHRREYLDSAPAVILGAAAARKRFEIACPQMKTFSDHARLPGSSGRSNQASYRVRENTE
jgi:hypothetical protein